MELLGIWYGDGSVTHGKNSNGVQVPKNINIVSFYNNDKLIDFVVNSFKTIFGINDISVNTDSHGMVSMIINNTIIAHLFVSIFKCKFDGKRIPTFFNKLSFDKHEIKCKEKNKFLVEKIDKLEEENRILKMIIEMNKNKRQVNIEVLALIRELINFKQ